MPCVIPLFGGSVALRWEGDILCFFLKMMITSMLQGVEWLMKNIMIGFGFAVFLVIFGLVMFTTSVRAVDTVGLLACGMAAGASLNLTVIKLRNRHAAL